MNQNQINNRPELLNKRKFLRNRLTPAEATLWKSLQNSNLEGRKFRRQHSVGPFIIDFYCPSEKLAVELDGQGHFTSAGQKYDEQRTKYLNRFNIRVIRIENSQVFTNLNAVLDYIRSNFLK